MVSKIPGLMHWKNRQSSLLQLPYLDRDSKHLLGARVVGKITAVRPIFMFTCHVTSNTAPRGYTSSITEDFDTPSSPYTISTLPPVTGSSGWRPRITYILMITELSCDSVLNEVYFLRGGCPASLYQ